MFEFNRLYPGVILSAVFFASAGSCADALSSDKAPAQEESFVIAPRGALEVTSPQRVLALCRRLLPTADESLRKDAVAALVAGGPKTVTTLTELLDAGQTADETNRLAVLAGIEALKPVGPEMSKRLAATALGDPAERVRFRSNALIKARNDEWAMDSLVKTYVGSFGEGGTVRDSAAQAAAGAALTQLGDKRVYNAMLYYATLEVRTQVSDLASFKTRQIDSYTVNNGQNATVITPLSFPIQFPELKITSVKTTVVAPCAALSALTGMDFGNDLDAWAKWIRKQK